MDTSLVLSAVAACLIAYFVCGIPSGLIIAKNLGHVDVRKAGSGNVGSTNVARSAGAGAGALTLVCDILKALVCVLVGRAIIVRFGTGDAALVAPGAEMDWLPVLVYLFCLLGHVFTPYLRFKGGKGIAVGFGGGVAWSPLFGLSLWVPFLLGALISRRVSVGSILAAICVPFLAALIAHPSGPSLALLVAIAVLVVWSHHKNIVRLIHGEEPAFHLSHDKKEG